VPKKLEIAYNQVEKAYNGSMQYIDGTLLLKQKSPIKQLLAGDVYQKSVDILAEKKLDKYFIHSLGHGTGLEIHELPNLSPKSKDVLKNGMVFSIEPGVYMPRLGGIRIEDLVYLENGKVKKFINVPTQLTSNIL
jgi:Xaa-Pro aminopeptidase